MNPSAKEILDSPVFKRAVENAERNAFDQWKAETSQANRETLWHRIKATEAITTELRVIAGDAVMEAHKRGK